MQDLNTVCVTKDGQGTRSGELCAEDLSAIHALSRRELAAEEVYTFSVRLCDNEVDRDGERFSTATLEEMAPMFVGKSGIFDHRWSAEGQSARIYRCEIMREAGRVTRTGEAYCWLKGEAYMLRSEGSRQLIEEIEAGIKKEVSVGCSVARKICSICGADVTAAPCEHRKGELYGGKLCCVVLEGAVDAYEFSFVAVPAQPAAGVVKGLEPVSYQRERLEREAELGRVYLKRLREDVVRLGMLAGLADRCEDLRTVVAPMGHEQLEQLREVYGRQAAKRYPLPTQLCYGSEKREDHAPDAAFLI